MPKGEGYKSSSKSPSSGMQGVASTGKDGNQRTYAGQPSQGGQSHKMGPALDTPNEFKEPAGNASHFPRGES